MKGGVASHQSAKLETMCRQELNANIYWALICTGNIEFPVWVSMSVAEQRNMEGWGGGGAGVVIRQTGVD